MTNEAQTPVAVVEGPNGTASILEDFGPDKPLAYRLIFNGQTEHYKSLGEAYIVAGEKAGVKT